VTILHASISLGHSNATAMKEQQWTPFSKAYKSCPSNVSILMNVKVSTSVPLTPTAIMLLPAVTPVNANLVIEEMVGLLHNRHQKEYKVPHVLILMNVSKKRMTVTHHLQHVPTLQVALNVNVVLDIVVLVTSLLMNSESSLMRAVGIPTNVLLPLLKTEDEEGTLKAPLLFQLIVVTLMLLVTTSRAISEDSLALVRMVSRVTDSLAKMLMNVPLIAINVMIMQHAVIHTAHTHANAMMVGLVPVWIVKILMNVLQWIHHVYLIPNAQIRMVHTLVNAMTDSKVMVFKAVVKISMNVMVTMVATLSVLAEILFLDMNVFVTMAMIIMKTVSAMMSTNAHLEPTLV
jgi:hypothetical protein